MTASRSGAATSAYCAIRVDLRRNANTVAFAYAADYRREVSIGLQALDRWWRLLRRYNHEQATRRLRVEQQAHRGFAQRRIKRRTGAQLVLVAVDATEVDPGSRVF